MNGDVSFRYAQEQDTPLILSFIKALAAYENMSDQVLATEELLHEWIFEKQKAEVLFAIVDGREIGFALFFRTFPAFLGKAGMYLEDIFILPEYRGRGYGKGLMRRIARIAAERGCVRLDWLCLTWNQSSIDFYLSLGAQVVDQFAIFRLPEDALKRLASGE